MNNFYGRYSTLGATTFGTTTPWITTLGITTPA
jgi:hypothetical protein